MIYYCLQNGNCFVFWYKHILYMYWCSWITNQNVFGKKDILCDQREKYSENYLCLKEMAQSSSKNTGTSKLNKAIIEEDDESGTLTEDVAHKKRPQRKIKEGARKNHVISLTI